MVLNLIIIKNKRKKIFKFFEAIFLISFFSGLLSVFLEDKIITYALVFIMVISGLITTFLKEHIVDGSLILDNSFLKIIKNKNAEVISVKSIDKLLINYSQYEGEYYLNPGSMATKKGIGNFITIYIKDREMVLEVLLRRPDVVHLNKLLQLWKEEGVNVIIKNEWGKKINEMSLVNNSRFRQRDYKITDCGYFISFLAVSTTYIENK